MNTAKLRIRAIGTGKNTKSYRDLLVWQKSFDLCEQVYLLTATFPEREIYGLSSQLRRAAVSVPSNLAQGTGRITSGEFARSVVTPEARFTKLRPRS